ncbi:MAG: tRNA threonylcarbamoyladenosine dehydratase [Myxococcales bacterium]|nr:tRNA threonylcarbamoyladenosine dehydratase [Myxococcales bacterium]MCB9525832.1 tRNA threonylcarbamoyladenosine dehydratase [Myxococcales bacterium]
MSTPADDIAVAEQDPRFGGIERLYGAGALARLRAAHVMVLGIGGVGSWAAEALARSGVGRLTLVDLDEVCVSNSNRQLHALEGAVGHPKVQVMAARLARINPDLAVHAELRFFTAATADGLLAASPDRPGPDLVLDCIDSPKNKALLIARAAAEGFGVVSVGGAGGRRDPTEIRTGDITQSVQDGLLRVTKRALRRNHGFVGEGPWGVPAVFSRERAVFPQADGTVCHVPDLERSHRITCATGFGTAAFVTGAYGLTAAGLAVDWLLGERPPVHTGR